LQRNKITFLLPHLQKRVRQFVLYKKEYHL